MCSRCSHVQATPRMKPRMDHTGAATDAKIVLEGRVRRVFRRYTEDRTHNWKDDRLVVGVGEEKKGVQVLLEVEHRQYFTGER